jgi:paraquat-inducible protein B
MSDENASQPAEAVVEDKARISIVWIIPIVAVLIGAFLSYRAILERGPTVTIRFATGEGLAAGKTTVRFKDIEVGKVTSLELDPDLSGVIVTAELNPGIEEYLTDKTRFWVVRATVSAGQVTGLGTLLSGAYIGLDPSSEGAKARHFVGLEVAPVVTRGEAGAHFTLRSEHLGSFNVGAPVYYRSIRVGQVVAYELDEEGQNVTVEVFIREPHHHRVHKSTRFWDASGIDVSLGVDGVQIDSPSLVSMLIGGVAFDSGPGLEAAAAPDEGQVFLLFENRQASLEKHYSVKRRYLAYFRGSVQGLDPGAPVMLRGIKIGEVVDLKLVYDADRVDFSIPVLMELQPERVDVGLESSPELDERPMRALVKRGLRAQLVMSNLLTGQLQIELDIFPDAEPAELDFSEAYPVVPTIETPLDKLASGLTRIVERLEEVPIEQIGDELKESMKSLRATLEAADTLLDPDGPTRRELTRAITELAKAARSARLLADYLEQHPEALLRGKEQ